MPETSGPFDHTSRARDTRGPNVARIFFGLVAAFIVWYLRADSLYPILLVHLTFAALWLVLIETGLFVESRHRWSAYVPSTLDLAWISVVVYITGHSASLFVVGYFVSNILTSMTARRNYGLFNAATAVLFFSGTGLALLTGFLPHVNFFDAAASSPPGAQTITAMLVQAVGLFVVNAIVHGLFVRMNGEIESRVAAEARLKAQNEELNRARVEAEKAVRAKSNFLANMSHEIRTPMNAVLGMTELLSFTHLNDEQRDYLSVIQRAGDGLLSIINDILDFSSIEAEGMKIQLESFRLDELVKQAVLLMYLQADQKGLRLEERLSRVPSGFFLGDAARIRQVLLNLLSNAIKFTPSGVVIVEVRANAGSTNEPDMISVHFEVSDTGQGIPEDLKGLLFKPFSQLDDSSTRRHGGTGLGLAISRRMVELMGGTIGFHSEHGEGSTFYFDLSLQRTTGSPSVVLLAASLSAADAARLHVLLVDDLEDNRILLHYLLGKVGVKNIEEAKDGEEAIRKWERGRYNLILLDMQMPLLDGYATAQRIRERERSKETNPVYIVGISASVLPAEMKRALESGCNEFLGKPVMADELHRALGAAVSAMSGP